MADCLKGYYVGGKLSYIMQRSAKVIGFADLLMKLSAALRGCWKLAEHSKRFLETQRASYWESSMLLSKPSAFHWHSLHIDNRCCQCYVGCRIDSIRAARSYIFVASVYTRDSLYLRTVHSEYIRKQPVRVSISSGTSH